MTKRQFALAYVLVHSISLFGQQSLGEVARQLRLAKTESADAAKTSSRDSATSASSRLEIHAAEKDGVTDYKQHINELFQQGKFADIDQIAEVARSKKSRFAGGSWKIYSLYSALAGLPADDEPSDSEWLARIDQLKQWVQTRKNSVTAPIALANAYLNYAYLARGGGYANTVADEGWRLFAERVQLARETLEKHSALRNKCPAWYRTMQNVALDQGWDKEEENALFRTAIAFEPEYQYYYRAHAYFLLPKWYGEEGESQNFANKIAAEIGGSQGSIIYFEIAGDMLCDCGNDEETDGYSWNRMKEGYNAIQQKYGTSFYNLNRLAQLAAKFHDPNTANKTFTFIGDHWDPEVWYTRRNFDQSVQWASRSLSPQN